ncbi:MAG: rane protein, partial [Enterobacter kobei]|nr:rane protein [Enterobacter kobei]
SGIALALVSVVCWAWYALRNARWLRENPTRHPMMWATAQGLVTLPVSLVGYIAACLWLQADQPAFALPFGPRPLAFIGLMTAIAILLIVFETLAGLLYTFLLRQSVPPLLTASGIALLVVGVVIAVRVKRVVSG